MFEKFAIFLLVLSIITIGFVVSYSPRELDLRSERTYTITVPNQKGLCWVGEFTSSDISAAMVMFLNTRDAQIRQELEKQRQAAEEYARLKREESTKAQAKIEQ